jgi:hypothetical protein
LAVFGFQGDPAKWVRLVIFGFPGDRAKWVRLVIFGFQRSFPAVFYAVKMQINRIFFPFF